jgi:hypothetical protein
LELCARIVSVDSGGDVRIYAVSPGGNFGNQVDRVASFRLLLTGQVGGFRRPKVSVIPSEYADFTDSCRGERRWWGFHLIDITSLP